MSEADDARANAAFIGCSVDRTGVLLRHGTVLPNIQFLLPNAVEDPLWEPFRGYNTLPAVIKQTFSWVSQAYTVRPVEQRLSYKNKGNPNYFSAGFELATRLEYVQPLADAPALPADFVCTLRGLPFSVLKRLSDAGYPIGHCAVMPGEDAPDQDLQNLLQQDHALYQGQKFPGRFIVVNLQPLRFLRLEASVGPRLPPAMEALYLAALSRLYEIEANPDVPDDPQWVSAELDSALYRLSLLMIRILRFFFNIVTVTI